MRHVSSRRRAPLLSPSRVSSLRTELPRRKQSTTSTGISNKQEKSFLCRTVVFWIFLLLLFLLLLCLASVQVYSSFSAHRPVDTSIIKLDQTTYTAQHHVRRKSDHATSLLPQDKILALIYPPGLMGGYRNQVIRIVAFCVYAMKHNIETLLLPSILWTTQIDVDGEETWVPIPHDLLFDVDYWNEQHTLPTLLEYDPTNKISYDCWSFVDPNLVNASQYNLLTQQVLQRGFLTPIANLSVQFATRQVVTNLRKIDVLPQVEHCTSPIPYGAGTGAGRLWNDYMTLQTKQSVPFHADAKVLNALRPKQAWRDLAMSCVYQHAPTKSDYMALHARIELEMMDHACGRTMERNLTVLLQRIEGLVHDKYPSIKGIFIAVSRAGIEVKQGGMYTKFKAIADDNLATMNRVVGDGKGTLGQGVDSGNVAVFECGRQLMDQYYNEHPDSINYGQLLQSMVNFYIATESTAFVGVRGSSYSTDIWTTRYHQGKGAQNYEYTLDGIQLMDNGGLPPPHKNCPRK